MADWSLIACVGAAVLGVLIFLTLVADEVRAIEQALEYRRRVEEAKQAMEEARNEAA